MTIITYVSVDSLNDNTSTFNATAITTTITCTITVFLSTLHRPAVIPKPVNVCMSLAYSHSLSNHALSQLGDHSYLYKIISPMYYFPFFSKGQLHKPVLPPPVKYCILFKYTV